MPITKYWIINRPGSTVIIFGDGFWMNMDIHREVAYEKGVLMDVDPLFAV